MIACTQYNRLASLVSIILLPSVLLMPSEALQAPSPKPQSRRNALQTTLNWLTLPSFVGVNSASAATSVLDSQINKTGQQSLRKDSLFNVYQVIPDASEALSPTIKPIKPQAFCNYLSLCNEKIISSQQGGAIWLGEHHNSKSDHDLQAQFIRSIYDTRKQFSNRNKNANHGEKTTLPLSIGLEQVQVQFQPILDDYVEGSITEETMLNGVEWDTRWTWPYDNYRPIFELAKELKIPLIALNVNSEDLAVVEESGIQGLNSKQIRRYIKDPKGFGDFSKPISYKAYSSYVIEPSYELHQQIGLLRTTMSGKQLSEEMTFRNFFSGRILWDEAMAGNAFDWNMKNPGGLMIGLVGADHVKFEKGITGRYKSLVNDERNSVSVLLNPTLIDTRPSGSVSNYANAASSSFPDQITLQLRYLKDDVDATSKETRSLPSSTGGVLSLADYIVISNTNA